MKKGKNEPIHEVYETHLMPDISVLYHLNMVCSNFLAPPNWHENLELLYFNEGEGVVLWQTEVLPVKKGDMVVLPANYLHSAGSGTKVYYDCMIIDRELALASGLDTSDFLFPAIIRDEKLDALFAEAKKAVQCAADDPFRVAQVHGAVLTLLAYLCRTYGEKKKAPLPRSLEGIQKAIRYLRQHVAETITVEKLAEVAGFSKYHFLRAFKKATSYTAVTYLNALRVERAAKLLRTGQKSVGEVALACGFNNFSYFSKIFRARMGVSPSSYARAGKNAATE